jgi:NAD(P)-dependent dehydrogenase (short-subunit alcohol dehydrogenase family)
MARRFSPGGGPLAGTVALITGAGRGIGRAVALTLAEEGATVVVTSRTRREVEETARLVRAAGGHGVALVADVASAPSVAALVRTASRRAGPIDVLVNNAGLLEPIGPIWSVRPAAWRRNVRVNLDGVFLCAHAVLPGMMARRRGVIVNVSSGAGRNPRYGWSAYCAAKAAVDHLTRVMAIELRDHGVRVNAVYPGAVETRMQAMIRSTDDALMGGDIQPFRDRYARGQNLAPELPARLIRWLVQQAELTGQVLDIYDPAVRTMAAL